MGKTLKIIFSLILFILVIMPLYLLCLYVHPSTDDFGFALSSNIWKSTITIYKSMDNRLAGNFLTLLFCNTKNLFLYRLDLVLFITLFFLSVYMFFHTINHYYFKTSKSNLFFLFAVFSFLFIGFNPSISELFYWYPGIVVWISSIVFFNLFIVLVICYIYKEKTTYFVLICILSFIMTSQNEIVFLFLIIFAFFLIYQILLDKYCSQKNSKIILFVVILIGSAIFIFGPGNYIRLKFISNFQPVSIKHLILYNILLYRKIFLLSDVVIFNLVLIPFYMQFSISIKRFINPLYLGIISLIILGVMLIPSFVANLLYSFRTQDVIYYFAILLLTINMINLSIFLRKKHILQVKSSSHIYLYAIIFLVLSYISQKESVFRTIYSDILSGKVMKYDKELSYRHFLINNSKSDVISVEPIQNKPKSVFISDITTDSNDWKNEVLSDYYGKKSIILKRE